MVEPRQRSLRDALAGRMVGNAQPGSLREHLVRGTLGSNGREGVGLVDVRPLGTALTLDKARSGFQRGDMLGDPGTAAVGLGISSRAGVPGGSGRSLRLSNVALQSSSGSNDPRHAPQRDSEYLMCVAQAADAAGFVGAAVGGAAAAAAGAPLYPKRWVGGRFGGRIGLTGGGPSGKQTSILSAGARSFFEGSKLGTDPVSRRLASSTKTRNLGGAVGKLASRAALRVIAPISEAYAAGTVAGAAVGCSEDR